MEIREATPADAEAMREVHEELFEAGRRAKRSDADFILSNYICDPQRIRCSVAIGEDGRLLGFQSLKRAGAGNPYGTPIGWGIIGTHIRPTAARQGIGARLFDATLAAAQSAGLSEIEAYIAGDNGPALAYYEAMGFRTWREPEGITRKVLRVEASPNIP